MNEPIVPCPFDQDVDIEARYLAGKLSATEAEAFEEHYFSCDRCFDLVQRAAEIRAAATIAPARRRSISKWWPSIAAAALLFAVGTGLWRSLPGRASGASSLAAPTDTNVLRGEQQSFDVVTAMKDSALLVSWVPHANASSYRIRVLSGGGLLLFEREYAGTSVALDPDLLRRNDDGSPVYVQVQALGPLRELVATSRLVRAPPDQGSP